MNSSGQTENSVDSERVYIDVGFTRIQRYLSRTAKLRGRRAASAGLARATDGDRIAAGLPTGLARRNAQAGAVDGVVSLELLPHDPADRHSRVEQVMDTVLDRLREQFPAAELQAVWGVGESYLAAYAAEIGPRKERGEVRVDLPALAEFPLAQPCRLCHSDPAAERRRVPAEPGTQAVCPDCAGRLRYDERARGEDRARARAQVHNGARDDGVQSGELDTGARAEESRQPDARGARQLPRDRSSEERRLQEQLPCAPAPETLEELAVLGLHRRPDARSGRSESDQLATVYIDGNAVGVFFQALAKAAVDSPELLRMKQEISRDLAACTRDSLAEATLVLLAGAEAEGTGPTDPPLPVIPHVVGGDDVLVSVPAGWAWAFTLCYLREFRDQFARATATARDQLAASGFGAVAVPTASAAIVFAHHSYPLHLLVDLVDERLRAAKRAVAGKEASVDFLDVTSDGLAAPADPPLPLAALDRAAADLRALAALPASHRERLSAITRSSPSGLLDAEALAIRVAHPRAQQILAAFLPPPDHPEELPGSGIGLEHALRIARWWSE